MRNVAYKYKITPESPWEPIRCAVNRLSAEPGPTEVVLICSLMPNMQIRGLGGVGGGEQRRQSVSCCSIIRAFSVYGSVAQSGPSPAAPGFYSNAFKNTDNPVHLIPADKVSTKVLIPVFATTQQIRPRLEAEEEISLIHGCTSFVGGERCRSELLTLLLGYNDFSKKDQLEC